MFDGVKFRFANEADRENIMSIDQSHINLGSAFLFRNFTFKHGAQSQSFTLGL